MKMLRVGQGFAHLLGRLACILWHSLSHSTHPGCITKGRATEGLVIFKINLLQDPGNLFCYLDAICHRKVKKSFISGTLWFDPFRFAISPPPTDASLKMSLHFLHLWNIGCTCHALRAATCKVRTTFCEKIWLHLPMTSAPIGQEGFQSDFEKIAEFQAKTSRGCRFLLFWHHSYQLTLRSNSSTLHNKKSPI